MTRKHPNPSQARRRTATAIAAMIVASIASVAAAAAGWTIFATPSPSPDAQLLGVAMLGTSDVWAVGRNFAYSLSDKALILRFNGSSWSQFPAPDSTSYDEDLNDVAFASSSD